MNKESEKVFNQKIQKNTRQNLRNSVSVIERLLWSKIRNQQLGVKFRRQHGIGKYIVDFYCPDFQLVIELDGDSHYQIGVQEYDRIRDEFMKGIGLRVLRFTNIEIMNNLDGVLLVICDDIKSLTPSQPPP